MSQFELNAEQVALSREMLETIKDLTKRVERDNLRNTHVLQAVLAELAMLDPESTGRMRMYLSGLVDGSSNDAYQEGIDAALALLPSRP